VRSMSRNMGGVPAMAGKGLRRLTRNLVVTLGVGGAVLLLATTQSGARSLFESGYAGTVAPGASVTVTGDGFKAGSTVTLTLDTGGAILGSVVADGSGKFSVQVTIPGGASGSHNIVATGVDPSGAPHSQSTLLLVQAGAVEGSRVASPVVHSGSLPFTGSNVDLMVAVAVALLLLGGAFVRGSRRHPATDDTPAP
jgi:hypothetical protein